MKHPLDDGTELLNPIDGKVFTEQQRFGFFSGLQEVLNTQYKRDRKNEYPPIEEYIDGVVKGDQNQIDQYIEKCLAVKAKYPKPDQEESF
jgi:hypothetical protein